MAIRREGPLENDGEYGDTSGLDCVVETGVHHLEASHPANLGLTARFHSCDHRLRCRTERLETIGPLPSQRPETPHRARPGPAARYSKSRKIRCWPSRITPEITSWKPYFARNAAILERGSMISYRSGLLSSRC